MSHVLDRIDRRRTERGVTRADLARAVGVHRVTLERIFSPSEPTDPKLSTVQRLAEQIGQEIRLVPRRDVLLSRALSAVVVSELRKDPDRVMSYARSRLNEFPGGPNQRQYRDAWGFLLDAGVDATIAVLLEDSDFADSLRAMTPFTGIVSQDTREGILAAIDAMVA